MGLGPSVISANILSGSGRVVGDGAVRYADNFSAGGFTVDSEVTGFALPETLLAIAAERTGNCVAVTEIKPLYLRQPDAIAKWSDK